MIRHLKVARDTAVKARTQAMLTLKAVIIAAPAALREKLEAITGTMALVRHLAALRPGAMTSPTASVKASLRALARRWLASMPRSRPMTLTLRPWSNSAPRRW
jgi:transposase